MSGPVNWAAVFAGRGFEAETWAEREARRIALNEPYRRDFEDAYADESKWPLDAEGRPYDPRAVQRKIVADGWPGQVIGGGSASCSQCQAEERFADSGARMVFDRTEHEHWLADKRLEERLKDAARISRAELDGGIRVGGLPDEHGVLQR